MTSWAMAGWALQILIRNFMFVPMAMTVKAGSTVTWVNRDDEPHTVVSDRGLFRSAALDTGEAFSFTFDEPGTYHVFCSIHPQMAATITVEPQEPGGPLSERGASGPGAPTGADRGP
ncbi:MAG TPA: cupredoxin family copper-binding protein [Steroidobacteraceae bacterium]|nr:cupredoxin family copper-binding protein [Steroidobacteraceae bacterium]